AAPAGALGVWLPSPPSPPRPRRRPPVRTADDDDLKQIWLPRSERSPDRPGVRQRRLPGGSPAWRAPRVRRPAWYRRCRGRTTAADCFASGPAGRGEWRQRLPGNRTRRGLVPAPEEAPDYAALTRRAREGADALAPANQPPPPPTLTTEQKAANLKELAEATYLYSALVDGHGPATFDVLSYKVLLDDFLREAGAPADPIERLLLVQLFLGHHALGR